MEDLGLLVQCLEGAHPADAEQDFLAEAVLSAAAVKPVGDFTQVIGVIVDVGVQKVQLHPADVRHPDAGRQDLPAEVDGDPGAFDRGQGHGMGVHARVALLLPPVGVEALAEVTFPVEKADADHRDPEAAGGL